MDTEDSSVNHIDRVLESIFNMHVTERICCIMFCGTIVTLRDMTFIIIKFCLQVMNNLKYLLAKRMNFAPAPKKLNTPAIIVKVESALNHQKADKDVAKTKTLLTKSKPEF